MARQKALDVGVRVHGLRELNKAVREISREAQKELSQTNKDVAELVAGHAKANAAALGGVAAKVAPSIRATASTTWAGVGFGGAAYPFAGGAEFGAYRYKQFQPWRGNGSDAGYFLYPAIRQDADQITAEYEDALGRLVERNGLR